MKEIQNYMTPAEAAYRWGVARETLRDKYNPSKMTEEKRANIQSLLDEGLIKYFLHPKGQRKEWIISQQAMVIWFGDPVHPAPTIMTI
ncbi:hypothetical protein [Bacillus gaemokensis]|uniref:Uncharacterized protein n=1 Tax=Bacillus gaemokensis TaxID=574375 RepID=A0A073K6E1_9BACI|nr:hypothetical protein [Bacillus gaemokensis]KEK22140.1 hypothetical protein BAGA_20910 [Bacillus gaemokensis]KYG35577.1 hypothetical protein AZF08_26235 [Bacillus gaemokensis]